MSEGPVNLNWGPIMKHVNENPFEFFQGSGWSFLGGAAGVEVCYFLALSNLKSDPQPNNRVITLRGLILSPNLRLRKRRCFPVRVAMMKANFPMPVGQMIVDLTLEEVMTVTKVRMRLFYKND